MLLIHTETDDRLLMESYYRRENEWLSFAKGACDGNNSSCSREKLAYLLRDLQEYLALDISSFDRHSKKTIIQVSDNLARIASWFAEGNSDLDYPIEKLQEIYILLFQDFIKLDDNL